MWTDELTDELTDIKGNYNRPIRLNARFKIRKKLMSGFGVAIGGQEQNVVCPPV